ncbi:hypothetical protein BOX15_Mlig019906g1 [Macrostomum lignano]|nr:hypothetical protein BOX15_Mlig027929g1 [Macrostomum lignano]PAA50176.1 hypothetical protein BOX15_Mlig019906g1 [Macrostomum lignano]
MDCGRPVISVESSTAQTSVGEFVDLQLDYWTGGSDRRTALKPALRALRVCQAANGRGLSLSLVNKRQKIMRLGKKGKEPESRRETVEGLTRLICTGKSQPMRVFVDGVEWSGVKFFQLSSQWQTSVKFLPVAVYTLAPGNNGFS